MPTILTITQGGTDNTTIDGIKQSLNIREAASYGVTSNIDQSGQYLPSINLQRIPSSLKSSLQAKRFNTTFPSLMP